MAEERAYEPGRLARGARLAVQRLGPGEYAVQGSHGVRFVNLNLDTPCDCEDAQFHGRPCKHEIGARLQEGDSALILALGEQLARKEQNIEELLRESIKLAKAKKAATQTKEK